MKKINPKTQHLSQLPKPNSLESLSRETTVTPVSNPGVQTVLYLLWSGNIFYAYTTVSPKIPHNYQLFSTDLQELNILAMLFKSC